MLYALALTDEIYEALTGLRLPEDLEGLDRELIEQFKLEALRRLGDSEG